MSGLRDLAKGGWHPRGKEGNRESFRSEMKGVNQMAGWVGRGKSKTSTVDDAKQHHSAPLSTLKDPALFGPPPKHIQVHGPGAVPDKLTPDTSGWGGPVTRSEYNTTQQDDQDEYDEQEEHHIEPSLPPRVPHRTDNKAAPGPPPPPPPRLPPRQIPQTPSIDRSTPPPSTYTNQPQADYLNSGALNRLGQAGISVPAFNVGQEKRGTNEKSSTVQGSSGQLNELQSRFARMQSPSSPPASETPSQGTTWAQKQHALQTAANFKKDPSSVSLSDARNTASTVRNFQQRHGEQVASGLRATNNINQKYGVSDKIGGLSQTTINTASKGPQETRMASSNSDFGAAAAAAKKPAPLPPPKKKNLVAGGDGPQTPEPPPIPLASKPR